MEVIYQKEHWKRPIKIKKRSWWREIMRTFTAYIEYDPETKLYIGIVPGIPGAHTEGATLDELRTNLKEVLELCLEEFEGDSDELPQFVGIQQIEVEG
jgi:predicted RNase H-like HicB family nuclease